MMRWLRRLFWLSGLTGGGYGTYRVWRQRQASPATPQWPAMSTQPSERAPATTTSPATVASPRNWVPPVNGKCPEGYPVKANDNSGIYHVPGGRFYARTVAERCYANADAAIADGYRAAKA